MKTSKRKTNGLPKKKAFNAQAFLDSAGVDKKVKHFKKAEIVFSQGSPADSVMYIQEGAIKITALSPVGKEAIIAILHSGDFFGEGCMAGQPLRVGNATAITSSTVLVIEKKEMAHVLHDQHELSD